MAENRKGPENAAQKIVRLLKSINSTLIAEGSGQEIKLELDADGAGFLLLHSEVSATRIYGFKEIESLVKYLEADALHKIVASVTWAEINL
jgi:hypothetical protein